MRGLWFVVILLLGAGLPPVGVLAQSQPGFDETKAAEQKRLLEEQTRAGEASQQVLPTLDAITYGDVLKDPDNIDLNFRYAKAQVARGNVRGAASTLERILLIAPNLPQIRLMYAIVLFRLDDIVESEREFLELRKLKNAPEINAEIDKFLKAIENRRKTTRVRIQASMGVQHDTNVISTPRDGKALFAGFSFDVVAGQEKSDFAVLGVMTADVTHDLGRQAPDKLLISTTVYLSDQMDINQQDLLSGSVSAGLKLNFDALTMTPRLTYTDLRLSHEKFYTGYGGDVLFEHRNVVPLFGGIDGYFQAGVTREKFSAVKESSTAPQRDGPRLGFEAGLTKQITPQHRLKGGVAYTHKFANTRSAGFNSYWGAKALLQHAWLPGGGNFLLTALSYANNLYEKPDPIVTAGQTRHDRQIRARATFGTPLSNVFRGERFRVRRGQGIL